MKNCYTCVICPNGCEIEVETSAQGEIVTIAGAGCKRGVAYARQETVCPQRTLASSIRVHNGEEPLVSVRLSKSVPRDQLMRVMEAIRSAKAEAPVTSGSCLIANVLGLGSDVIATKSVARKR
ncbi:MAG: DUF1667 domain-containing protein [Clostridiales bacterium]|nr:DUF1667 domain-containing protein [Clostridiales bacterium]MDY4007885.1 DUF1667 domain-containing protein [Candidatus Limiplasma sp.]